MRTLVRGRRNPLHLGLSRRLKEARQAAQYPASYLSRDAGLSHATVFSIEEQGRVPGIDIAEALALCLGASPCWLAFGIPLEPTAMALQAPDIGERLGAARARAGLSVNALSKAAGLSHTAVGNIESAKVLPGVDVAEALANALGISPCWLAFGEGEPSGPRLPPPIKKRKPAAPRRARKPAGRSSRRKAPPLS